MNDFLFKEETYKIIGLCMEVHRTLGRGLSENLYKDALEIEFTENSVPYNRENEYEVKYKDKILPHKYYADFVVYENIILEVKACKNIVDDFVAQTLNYMAIANSKVGLIINFGVESLQYKRLAR